MDCRLCAKSFSKVYQCCVHKKMHVFKCNDCLKELYSKKDLDQLHAIDHVEYKRFCKICKITIFGKEFYAYHRYMHMRINLKRTNKYKCDNCEQSFEYEKAFKAHRLKCDNKPSQLQCDLCSAKPFGSKFCLEQHVRKHTSEYTHTCNVCNKGFLSKSVMLAHVQSHGVILKDHPFQCEDCGAQFSKQFNLERHAFRFHYAKQESSIEEEYSLLIGLEIEILDKQTAVPSGGMSNAIATATCSGQGTSDK